MTDNLKHKALYSNPFPITNCIPVVNSSRELKQEGRLPSGQYKLDYDYLIKVIEREVMNRETLTNIFSSLPSDKSSESERKKQVRKLVKDTIEAYCNKEKLEAEAAMNAKKYDWEALEYR